MQVSRPDPECAAVSSEAALTLVAAGSSRFNQRWSVRLRDGARVECVLYRGDSLCVSSQVGCAVGCPFCASGAQGLSRALGLDELIGQVEAVRGLGHPVVRVTLSGVGEPLHNSETVRAFVTYCHAERLRPSLTTSGGPLARLREWLHAPHNGLTLSIHAGSEAVRAQMVPKGPTLAGLFGVLNEELPRMTRRRRRKTALAYLLCAGVNDRADELASFAARAAPLGLRVHLYAYNPVPNSRFQPVDRAGYEAAAQQLTAAGLSVHMSSQARLEANGGCGTLIALVPSRSGSAQR
jgi:23S rRNA (adenine2503-C2)-methyltransferase